MNALDCFYIPELFLFGGHIPLFPLLCPELLPGVFLSAQNVGERNLIVMNDEEYMRLALALANDSATESCYRAADEAMRGVTNVGQCVYFRTPIPGLNGIRIGGHIFY